MLGMVGYRIAVYKILLYRRQIHRHRHGFFSYIFRKISPISAFRDETKVRKAVFAERSTLSAIIFQIPNRIAQGTPAVFRILVHLKVSWKRQKNIFVISAPNQNKPFAELWNAVIHCIQYTIYRFISQLVKLRQDHTKTVPNCCAGSFLSLSANGVCLSGADISPFTFSMIKNRGRI